MSRATSVAKFLLTTNVGFSLLFATAAGTCAGYHLLAEKVAEREQRRVEARDSCVSGTGIISPTRPFYSSEPCYQRGEE